MKQLRQKVVSEPEPEKVGRPKETPSSRVSRTTVRRSVNGTTPAKASTKTTL